MLSLRNYVRNVCTATIADCLIIIDEENKTWNIFSIQRRCSGHNKCDTVYVDTCIFIIYNKGINIKLD